MSVIASARPKVNLFLHITGKRTDGYHLLQSLVCFTGSGDVVQASLADQLTLVETGPYAKKTGATEDNLVLRAAEALRQQFGVARGARLQLQKNLPVASGIGGGSADAAATLHLLNDVWELKAPDQILAHIGAQLGADVPVCVYGKPAIMSGIGEKVAPIGPVPAAGILLINPGIAVSTPTVFSELQFSTDPRPVPDLTDTSLDDFVGLLKQCRNDLQAGAIRLVPQIAEVIAALNASAACRLARMSGSGATCFGLYETQQAAEQAKAVILQRHPHWWGLASTLQSTA